MGVSRITTAAPYLNRTFFFENRSKTTAVEKTRLNPSGQRYQKDLKRSFPKVFVRNVILVFQNE